MFITMGRLSGGTCTGGPLSWGDCVRDSENPSYARRYTYLSESPYARYNLLESLSSDHKRGAGMKLLTKSPNTFVCVEAVGSVARSSDVDDLRPIVYNGRPASTASQSSAYVQQLVGCIFGGALAMSLLVATALVLCRRGRRAQRRAVVTKATAASARSTSTFRLFGGHTTSMTREDSATLTSTGKTTSNGLSSFSNCSVSAAGGADNEDDDEDYDVTTLARCFRLPHDVIQARQLPKPPPPPHLSSPYHSTYLTGAPLSFFVNVPFSFAFETSLSFNL